MGEKKKSSKIFIIGYGEAGKAVAQILRLNDISYTILEQNYAQVKAGRKAGEEIYLGDATNTDELLQLGIADAELVVISVSGVHATSVVVEKMLGVAPRINIIVRVHNTRQAKQLSGTLEEDSIVDAERISSEALRQKVIECLDIDPTA